MRIPLSRAAAPSVVPAAAGTGLAVLLALASAAGPWTAAAALVVVVGALAAGWSQLLSLPSPRSSAAVVAAGGVTAVVAVLLTDDDPFLAALPAVLALAVLGAFVHQLLRRDLRPRVVDGLSGTVTGLLVLGSSAAWLGALATTQGRTLVLVAATAVAAASLAGLVPARRRLGPLAALVAGALAGAAAAAALGGAGAGSGALLGGSAGLLVGLVHRLLDGLPSAARPVAGAAAGAAPVAACGVLVYALGRALLG